MDHFARHEQSRAVNRCEILTPEPIKPRVFVTAIRKYIITSIDKYLLFHAELSTPWPL